MAIQNRAEVLKQLTEELFRYSIIMSAQEPMQLEPLCVNDMLEQSIVSFYATLTKRGITPQIDITEKRIMRTILGTLADWGIGERGETSKTWKFDFGEFYELTLDFYHWLRRCIEGYMERNRPSWYCKARFQWIVQSQVIVLKPKKEMRGWEV